MNTCRHVQKIRLSSEHSVLNSQKWKCVNCGSQENIWACLSCSHVACGKYLDEHIKQHYEAQKHPLSINVWEKYVYCYDCDDYVLNDNAAGDIKILRSCLQAISQHQKHHLNSSPEEQSFLQRDVLGCRRSSRVQRSSTNSIVSMLHLSPGNLLDSNEEVAYTELWFRRYYLLAHFFNKWKLKSTGLEINSSDHEDLHDRKRNDSSEKRLRSSSLDPPSKRRKHIIPGAVGLQNLGNTCYMNSILQVLKHLSQFSKVFLEDGNGQSPCNRDRLKQLNGCLNSQSESKDLPKDVPLPIPTELSTLSEHSSLDPTSNSQVSSHDSPFPADVEATFASVDHTSADNAGKCHTKLRSINPISKSSVDSTLENLPVNRTRTRKKVPTKLSLSHELNSLLQIMWSGKMTLVSPHKMLYAVWNLIPFFRGYSQQDAQEFLSEFLDKVQSEMDIENLKNSANGLRQADNKTSAEQERSSTEQKIGEDIVTQLFQGELISQVKCLTCGYESNRREAFMDLSLEFPLRFHRKNGSNKSNSFCRLEEMLGQFMQAEKLDGKIYACEECNRTISESDQTIYSEAEKKFFVSKLPNVLRLHLKRFMWSGRSSRGKITVNVAFPQHLNISEFCHPEISTDNSVYNLSAVVMHHGRGFGSGHYTAYCWNNDADSWLHCNDAKMQKATLDDVQKAQAYILVYTKILKPPVDSHNGDSNDENSWMNGAIARSMIPKFADATKRLRVENLGFYSIKRTKTTIW